MFRICICVRRFCQQVSGKQMKFLNVAEKNDAAKTISSLLSRGSAQRVRNCYSLCIQYIVFINGFNI